MDNPYKTLDLSNTGDAVRYFGVVVLLATVCSLGCGPIVSGVQIINANIEISAAETAGALKHAIYEHTAAVEYLQKAREEHGYSDFAASRAYADKAFEFAERALKKAEMVSKMEGPAVLPVP